MNWFHSRSQDRPRFVPQLESLERREVPAVSIVQSGTTVFVNGDQFANTVQITDDGTSGADAVTIQIDSLTQSFAGTINKIIVETGQQHDQVSYHLTGDLLAGVSRAIEVYLEQGKDTFHAQIDGAIGTGDTLRIRVHGDQGKDSLSVDATDVDIAVGTLLRIYMDGKNGKDFIAVNYSGQVLGKQSPSIDGPNQKGLWLQLEGGRAPDTVSADLTLDDGSTGDVRAWVLGQNGPDDLTLLVSGPGAKQGARRLLLDGGLSPDDATFSSGVRVKNVP
jgi:hypothetical protein